MTMYYLLVFIPLLFYINFYFKKSNAKYTFGVFFAMLFFILSLRHAYVGCDLDVYTTIYDDCATMPISKMFSYNNIEFGYLMYNALISKISGGNFQFLLTVTAVITVLPVAIVYTKESKDPYLTIALFLCLGPFILMFSGLRQSMAMSLCMIAFLYVKKRKFFKFLIPLVLAVLMHYSAAVFLLVYPLYSINVSKKFFLYSIPVLIVMFIFNKPIIEFIVQFLPEKYRKYELTETGAFGMLIAFILISFYSFICVDESRLSDEARGLRNLMIPMLLLQIFVPVHGVVMRVNYYLIMLLPLSIPAIQEGLNPRLAVYKRYISFIIMLIAITYILLTIPGSILRIYPYYFFWETPIV